MIKNFASYRMHMTEFRPHEGQLVPLHARLHNVSAQGEAYRADIAT